ncbi:hypothetical protein PHMEG_00014088 [Phytophthora megakarya]|uniref:Uncharacterized protein n=1 Tax=Phytophthora megakarya TaxID=4795 RepID=A0A225W5R7_9STRA|nr:hypothetical protein PHMEG_00014088 [Phytophthora megakarya]
MQLNADTARSQMLATITFPDNGVLSLNRVLEWAYNTSDKNYAKKIIDSYPVVVKDDLLSARTARSHRVRADDNEFNYNFVIPHVLVIKLDAVLRAEKNKRPPSNYFATWHPEMSTKNSSSTIYAGSASNGVPIWIGYNRATEVTYRPN